MEFLGIGPLELLFIILIALIVLGPKDMVKAGRTLGKLMRKTILSPTWLNLQRQMRNLPYTMMREAGIEEEEFKEIKDEFNQAAQGIYNDATINLNQPTIAPPPARSQVEAVEEEEVIISAPPPPPPVPHPASPEEEPTSEKESSPSAASADEPTVPPEETSE